MEVFQSLSEIYLTVIVTIVEISVILMVYAVYKTLKKLGEHPTFKTLMKEADAASRGEELYTGNPGNLDELLKEDLDEEGN